MALIYFYLSGDVYVWSVLISVSVFLQQKANCLLPRLLHAELAIDQGVFLAVALLQLLPDSWESHQSLGN